MSAISLLPSILAHSDFLSSLRPSLTLPAIYVIDHHNRGLSKKKPKKKQKALPHPRQDQENKEASQIPGANMKGKSRS